MITAGQALADHVMRVARSAIDQPRQPTEYLQHKISGLGLAEASDFARTVAVQGNPLSVPGQGARIQRMWKQAGTRRGHVSSPFRPAGRGEPSYLAGLLHAIGKRAALRAIAEP